MAPTLRDHYADAERRATHNRIGEIVELEAYGDAASLDHDDGENVFSARIEDGENTVHGLSPVPNLVHFGEEQQRSKH